ncbi:hypothetical protein ACV229_17470 [Burkholderia sp. MR1-5-21]
MRGDFRARPVIRSDAKPAAGRARIASGAPRAAANGRVSSDDKRILANRVRNQKREISIVEIGNANASAVACCFGCRNKRQRTFS